MKKIRCPLCNQEVKAFVCPGEEDLWKAGCFTCQWETAFTSLTKQKALQKAEEFVSKFPPIMRVIPGDQVIIGPNYVETITAVNREGGYMKFGDGGHIALPMDVAEWPWELEQK